MFALGKRLERRLSGLSLLKLLLVAAALGLTWLVAVNPAAAAGVLALGGGIVALLVLIRNPLIGVGLVVTLAVTGGLTQLLPDSILQRLFVIVLGLTLLAYCHHLYSDPELLRDWLRLRLSDVLFVAFALVAVISINEAYYKSAAIRGLYNIARAFVLYFLCTRAIRSFDDLVFVSKFLLVGGLWQVSTAWSDSGFRAEGGEVVRIGGNLENVNSYAAALLMALPWAFFHLRHGKGIWRVLGLAGAMLLPYTLLGALSRASVVVLIAIGVFWPLASARALSDKLKVFIPVLIVCAFGLAVRWDAILARWPSLQALLSHESVTYVIDDDGGRGEMREMAAKIFQEHWQTGVGVGNTPYLIGAMKKTFQPFRVHNMYYEVAADLGVIGLGAFLALIGFSVLAGLRALLLVSSDRDRALIASATCQVIILIILGTVGNRNYALGSYYLIACGYLVLQCAWRERGLLAGAKARAAGAAAT